MNYHSVNAEIIAQLRSILGDNAVTIDKEQLQEYGHDETENLSYPPEILVKPANTKEVAAVMQLASKANIAVTPIGARTGLSGGSLSLHGGIGLSLERFDQIFG